MFVRNLLQAGDYVTIVPAGVRITLQYSEKGSLEAIYEGHANNQILHPELMTPIIQSGEVPTRINVTKGTSYVYGVLYSEDILPVEGCLDKEVEVTYLTEYIKNPSTFKFYAGHIQSYAVGFNAPLNIGRWLTTAGFKLLPSYVVPPNLREVDFAKMLNLEQFKFRYPRIQSYIVHKNGKCTYPSTHVKQIVVKTIKRFNSYDGYIVADIYSHDLGAINVSFSDVVRFNIQKGSILLVNEDSEIIDCFNGPKVRGKQSDKIECSACGRILIVPKHGRFHCTDNHCSSIMYQHVERMLGMLGVDLLDLDSYNEYAKTVNHIISLPDILDLEKYSDTKISIDAPKLLHAVVPTSVITRFNDWAILCSKANNSIDSIKYYLQNPDKMMTDLNLDGAIYRRLYHWLQDNQNLNDVIGMLEHPKIHVISTGRKFEGAPIFRGKSIYVTGEFSHGNFETVRAILASYSAEVYDMFNTAVDCVIIGDLHERISGNSVKKAKQLGIPVFEEKEFFSKYDIDLDLKKNNL